ncbi:MAG: hypothetical protein HY255_12125 [Betaproteobacteria bacterium]|nr:hypothetical protein [Betaproteobacteria bacterium]
MNTPVMSDSNLFSRSLRLATTWALLATLFAWGALATMYIQGVQSRAPSDARVYADGGQSRGLPTVLLVSRR